MGDGPGPGGHVFLCYARQDSDRVDELERALRSAGLPVWRDTAELWPGQDWQDRIRRAITEGTLVFLACFSRTSVMRRAGYQNAELALAAEQARLVRPGTEWLIPVRFDDCGVPDLDLGGGRRLDRIHRADLFGPRQAAKLERLVTAVSRILEHPQALTAGSAAAGGPAYLLQVRQIAPPSLLGREAELAELAAFCAELNHGPYAWWRGGPWAGKSALLSTFVLRAPPQFAGRVWIVSFFITARLTAQNTRDAFIQVLLDQLAALTGQDLPAALPQATRVRYLLDLLDSAARQCQDAGGRLVLVVDGLDEDRSVTTGPDARSIAGLLPADPPSGMRVIVSGRPGPPVPDDVPDSHPLRRPAVIRPLDPSPHARDIARLARQELGRLLHGTPVEQDVLGLITAARGGLSASDLAGLAGLDLWDVEDILHQAQGRTFTCRPSRHRPGAAPEVYLLGHEELQATALHYLARRMPGYYGRLAVWAGTWRDASWPPDTPEYLLAGYFQLLAGLGDVPAMTVLACDAARHDRMLDLTGGDAAAIAETRAALDAIAAQEAPDVGDALYVAWHRDQLTDRNADIPGGLPAVWATLGNTTRALALAASIPDLGRQAEALAQVAVSLAAAGEHEQAAAIARQAETTARSITDPYRQDQPLAQVAVSLAAAGQHGQAEAVARSITGPRDQARALAQVAVSLAAAGKHEQAAAIARQAEATARSATRAEGQTWDLAQVAGSLAAAGKHEQAAAIAAQAEEAAGSDPYWLALAQAQVAGSLAAAGQHEQAAAIAARAETTARSIPDLRLQAQALTPVAGSLAAAGQRERAAALAGQAGEIARSIPDLSWQSWQLASVAFVLADAGQHERAAALAGQAGETARLIPDLWWHAHVLAHVAASLAAAGQREQAAAIARGAETAARSAPAPGRQAQHLTPPQRRASERARALAGVADGLAAAGQHGQAETVARSITDPAEQARALAQVAVSLVTAGQHRQAETVARSITPDEQAWALAQVAGGLAAAGQHSQAERVARSITDPAEQAEALAQVAFVMAAAGQHGQAAVLARQAGKIARSITNADRRAWVLIRVAGSLAAAGQHEQAAAITGQAGPIARGLLGRFRKAEVLAQQAGSLAAAGQHEQAAALARQAGKVARSITDPRMQSLALQQVTGCCLSLAAAGQHEQAAALARQAGKVARSITDPYYQAHALADVADSLTAAGQHEQAAAISGQAEAAARSITDDPDGRARALAPVAGSLARAGQHDQAETLARSITDDPDSQAWALAQVAMAIAAAGDTVRARQLTAAAFATATWTFAAVPALTLNASAWARLNPAR